MQTVVIRIDRPTADDKYPVRGIRLSTDGQQISNESLGALPCPLPPVKVGGRDSAVAEVLSETMTSRSDTDLKPIDAGRYLWGLLARTEAVDWWRNAVQPDSAAPLPTLLDVQAPDLRPLPWELMTRVPDGHRPFMNPKSSWSRGEGQPRETTELLLPVRMLVVVGEPNDPRLRVDDEVDTIMGALHSMTGRWHVEVLVKPTYDAFNRRLEILRPDILHVITHGRVDDDATVLTFPVTGEKPWDLTAGDVADLAGPPPRLVVLNACRSKEGDSFDTEGVHATWTFTDAFLELGALGVIAMQGNIPSDAAIPFSQALYGSLAEGDPVPIAVAKGRRKIFAATKGSSDNRSWAMPSLHLRGRPDLLLKVHSPVAGNPVQDQPYCTWFGKVPGYVDRSRERWQLLTNLDPAGTGPESPVYLVEGAKDVGKSAVAQAALLSYHMRGRRVVYLDVGGVRRTSKKPLGDAWGDNNDPDQFAAGWIDVLRALRDELGRWVPGADPYVRRFNDRLARYKTAGSRDPLPEYDPEKAHEDITAEAFEDKRENYQQVIGAVFAEFCTMLADIAGDEPLLLALDHLHKMYNEDLQNYVVPFLLDSLGQPSMAKVHVVLIDRPDQMKELRSRSALTLPEPLQISRFCRQQMRRLGGDYCAHLELLPVDERVIDVLKAVRQLPGEELGGTQLKNILEIIKASAVS